MKYCAVLLLFLMSCSQSQKALPPYAIYRGEFIYQNVPCAVGQLKLIAKKWDLKFFEKEKREMLRLNSGVNSFYIFMREKRRNKEYREAWVLTAGSFIKGSRINITIHNDNRLSAEQKKRLTEETVYTMSEKCNTKLMLYIDPYRK